MTPAPQPGSPRREKLHIFKAVLQCHPVRCSVACIQLAAQQLCPGLLLPKRQGAVSPGCLHPGGQPAERRLRTAGNGALPPERERKHQDHHLEPQHGAVQFSRGGNHAGSSSPPWIWKTAPMSYRSAKTSACSPTTSPLAGRFSNGYSVYADSHWPPLRKAWISPISFCSSPAPSP